MKIYKYKVSRRLVKEAGKDYTVTCAQTFKKAISSFFDHNGQEQFWVFSFSSGMKMVGGTLISQGLANRTLVHPREIFRPAILSNAVSIMIAHSHPNGDLTPSREDDQITKQLVKAGNMLGIPVLDHLIIREEDNEYYSYLMNDKL